MNEITLRISSSHAPIDPGFIQYLENYIEQHGCLVEEIQPSVPTLKQPDQASTTPAQTRSLLTDWRRRLEIFREQTAREVTNSAR
jgi:hypothetical protein